MIADKVIQISKRKFLIIGQGFFSIKIIRKEITPPDFSLWGYG